MQRQARFWLKAATMAVAVGSLSTAAEARVGWHGRAVYTDVTPTCNENDQFFADPIPNVSFFPANLSDNGGNSYLSFIFLRAAYSVKVTGNFADGAPYTAVKINSYGKSDTNGIGQVLNFVSHPELIDEETRFINMKVKITNFLANTGCTVNLDISMVRRF
jgi:hypothetical protein